MKEIDEHGTSNRLQVYDEDLCDSSRLRGESRVCQNHRKDTKTRRLPPGNNAALASSGPVNAKGVIEAYVPARPLRLFLRFCVSAAKKGHFVVDTEKPEGIAWR